MSPRVSVIIPAAGSNKRMNPPGRIKGFPQDRVPCKQVLRDEVGKRKPFILLAGKPVVAHALDVFRKIKSVKEIILVVNKKDLKTAKRFFSAAAVKIIQGASARSGSVFNGLKIVDKNCNIVLIHDGVRPFVTRDIVTRSIRAAARFGAAVAAVPAISTIKTGDKRGFVGSTLNRRRLWEIQTPQAFRKDIIINAFKRFAGRGAKITDDAMLVERTGRKVKIIRGSYRNIKITTPDDIKIAKAIMKSPSLRARTK